MSINDVISILALGVSIGLLIATIIIPVLIHKRTSKKRVLRETPRLILTEGQFIDDPSRCSFCDDQSAIEISAHSLALANFKINEKDEDARCDVVILNFSEKELDVSTAYGGGYFISKMTCKNVGDPLRSMRIDKCVVIGNQKDNKAIITLSPDANFNAYYFKYIEKGGSINIYINYFFSSAGNARKYVNVSSLKEAITARAAAFGEEDYLNKRLPSKCEEYNKMILYVETVSSYGDKYEQKIIVKLTEDWRYISWAEEGWDEQPDPIDNC